MSSDPRSYVFTRSELLRRGLDDRQIASAVAERRLTRLRRGWYSMPDIPPTLRAAVTSGGRLACVSALEWHGVWTLKHKVHVSLPSGAHRSRTEHVSHWRPMPSLNSSRIIEDPPTALAQFVTCGTAQEVVIVADSAINLGVLSVAEVENILEKTYRGRRLMSRVDGKAESGTETMVRMELRALRVKLRTQVPMRGVGRVDILIGDRLIVEVDGQTWHDRESTFESDRRRDARLVVGGYVVMRFSYNRVIDELDAVISEVMAIVRRREHRWRSIHRNNYG